MPVITFEGKTYDCKPEETVLDGLTRHGVLLPSSCRSGTCQTCMVRAVKGTPPVSAQEGIKDTLKAQGYFLACICKPEEDLEIALATVSQKQPATVISKTQMNEAVVRLRFSCDAFDYFPGQFINLVRSGDGLVRSYSLASIPADGFLELHIKKIPEGKMSTWACDVLDVGDQVEFFGPVGDCFYVPGNPEQPLTLAGTGTGLAPLHGIVRHALSLGHTGSIMLFHGSLAEQGLYMMEELRSLAEKHSNLTYLPCVLYGERPDGGLQGKIDDLVVNTTRDSMSKSRIFLCGDPPMVEAMRKKCFMAGASSKEIYADAFTFVPNSSEIE